ncbi:PAS domain S-box protein [Pseudomonas sp. PCH446]
MISGEEAEPFFVQTLEQAIDAVVVIDDHNCVVFFNGAAEQLWGCPRNEVLGHNVNTLVPQAVYAQHDGFISANRETGVNKIVGSSRDLRIVRKDGEERWGSLSISKITLQDRILYAAFLKDITQARLKDIEHRLLSISVNATRSATCIADANGDLIYVNDGFVRLLGYSREEVIGQSLLIFFTPGTQAEANAQQVLEKLLGGQSNETSALIGKRNGQRLWLHVSSTPVFDARARSKTS